MIPRVFGVDYHFLSCGDVFTQGLAHAASDLGVPYAHAGWDAPDLQAQIKAFAPNLIFVVHGRKFAQRFNDLMAFDSRVAVWLLDEPYEVDDTESFSWRFDRVFVNDPATLHRHRNASYLPVCYDPHVHHPGAFDRVRKVGFIGGANGTREQYLSAVAREYLLDYVVGGDWSDPWVNAVSLGRNVRPKVTADLYAVTKIVLNVFRETHHFNRDGILASAMNPRIYEALACGALVISERRAEIAEVLPELPTFRTPAECVQLCKGLLGYPSRLEELRLACHARIVKHTYAARLQTVLQTVGLAVAA
jgi:spore maturation protein CgeB